MIEGFLDIINKIESFSFAEEVQKIVYIEDDEVLALVRGQMSIGKDGNGNPIHLERGRTTYKRVTIELKEIYGVGIGKETRWITLYMTGEFYNSLFVEYQKNGEFSILSRDPKSEKIILRSGDDVLKLNQENLASIQASAFEFIQTDFNKIFNAY